MKHIEPEFKKNIVHLHLEKGRILTSLADEYGVSKASISIWIKNYREECQTNQETKTDHDLMQENRKQLEEIQKENQILKIAAAFLAKEID